MPHVSHASAFRQNTPHRSPRHLLLYLLTCFSASQSVFAQAEPTDTIGFEIGRWESHLAYTNASSVTACSQYTAYGTTSGVLLRFTDNDELRKLDKVNVLEQADVALVACNPYRDGQLLVAYDDGGVQVLGNGDRPQLYNTQIANANISGRRGFQRISFVAEDLALFSMESGLVLFDPQEGIFREDIRTSFAIRDAAVSEGDLYLATERGLRVLRDYERAPNLRDTSAYGELNVGLLDQPAGAEATALAVFQGEVYAAVGEALYALGDRAETARTVRSTAGYEVRGIDAGEEHLVITMDCREDCEGDLILVSSDGTTTEDITPNCFISDALAAVEAPEGTIAIADAAASSGFVYYPSVEADCQRTILNSPGSSATFGLTAEDGRLAVGPGELNQSGTGGFNRDGFFVRDPAGDWTNYTARDYPAIRGVGNPAPAEAPDVTDFVSVAFDDAGGLWAGSLLEGVVHIDSANVSTLYNETNSSLNNAVGDGDRTRVPDLAFDARGNLWVAQSLADRPLSVRTPGGEWFSFALEGCGNETRNFRKVAIDRESGIVWLIDGGGGVVAFDPGEDFADESDDSCRNFTTNDNLPTNDVRSIAVDRRGSLYVGTTDGLARIECGGNPFDEGCVASQPGAVVDDINGLLFDDAVIRSIAVDGGDRKWIGTGNGLFLITPSADDTIAIFGARDSPLFSDQIDALAFDDSNGKLWVGTAAGLLSLQTESTGGSATAHGTVEVSPQPVRPDYNGPIAIRGLAADSNVKIMDAGGRLVYETDAVGGTATWDGLDYTGRRPAAGVYLVWATAARSFDNNPETVVAKIALVR